MSPKQALYLASYYGGADRLARIGLRAHGAIVMFHRVVARPNPNEFHPNRELEVTPDVLRSIIRGLRESGLEIIPIDGLPDRLKDNASPPFACLTFDDGYRDNLEFALPVCAEMQAPLTLYLTTGFIDRTDPIWWEDLAALVRTKSSIAMMINGRERVFPTSSLKEKQKIYAELSIHLERAPPAERQSCWTWMANRYGIDPIGTTQALALSWEEARELGNHPLVTIGAHTAGHSSLASLTVDEARREIGDSKSRIESELDLKVIHFAYPYGGQGNAAEREFTLCKELGFSTAVTTRFGLIQSGAQPSLHALPRVPSNSFDDERTMRVKLSGLPILFSGD